MVCRILNPSGVVIDALHSPSSSFPPRNSILKQTNERQTKLRMFRSGLIQQHGGNTDIDDNFASPLSPSTAFNGIFTPRNALKSVSIGMLLMAIQFVLFETFLHTDGRETLDRHSDEFLLIWAVREMMVAMLSWAVATHGSSQLCRMAITLVFAGFSIPQLFYPTILRGGKDLASLILAGCQGLYLVYLSIATTNAWVQS